MDLVKTLSFYDQVIGKRVPCYREMLDIIAQIVNESTDACPNILDLGIFTGNFAEALLPYRKRFNLIGVDFVDTKALVKTKLKKLNFKGCAKIFAGIDLRDSGSLDRLPNAQFEFCVSSLLLHELPAERREEIFSAADFLLKKDGIFILMDRFLLENQFMAAIAQRKQKEWAEKVRENWGEEEHETYAAIWKLWPASEEAPDTIEDTCIALAKNGFFRVEVAYLYYQYAIIVAEK